MMKNKHLTAADRRVIEVLLNNHFTLSEIAKELKVSKSTVCREVNKRNTPNGYFANIAQLNYQVNRERCKRKKLLDYSKHRNYVLEKLTDGWSPEQIVGRLKNVDKHIGLICHHETIYRFVYRDSYCKENKIYQNLRFGRKRRRKKTGRKVHKSRIPQRVSIHKRPKITGEFGHWEGDSVIYINKKAIHTANELKTGLVVFRKLEQKTAENTVSAMKEIFQGYLGRTVTVDNGIEFMKHEELTKERKIKVYFCDPYSSWQRGSNENSNMLLRRYLPKRANIDDLTQEELDEIAEELNNRPRKRLNYLTPAEVYRQELFNLNVAVHLRM